MKNFAIIFILICLFSFAVFAQKPKSSAKSTKKPGTAATAAAAAKIGDETAEFEKALSTAAPVERIGALQKFLRAFPKSEQKNRALELIVSARAEIAEEKLRLSEIEEGVKLFTLAAAEAPKPISEELFAKVVLQLPTNLFFRGQPKAALEVAKIIEEKAEGNPRQLLALSTFYLGVENADEAKRLAEKVLAVEAAALAPETQVAAYQALGLANRLNFDLEASAAAYAKALELNPDSLVSKRSLAEMRRATGQPEAAAALYREILEKDATDGAAQSGLVLSLFNAEKLPEAEAELAKRLEANPTNLFLLTGAAYWYAARGQADKALEYAQKAVAAEPRYTWGQIALARALTLQKKPLEAEKALLAARQYGNFPTLDYELAAARLTAGFYEEAAAELRKTFAVTKDGAVQTRLGYRVPKEAKNFTELLALERRASIFEPAAGGADSGEIAERLKSLLNFAQKLDAKELSEAEAAEAAEEFARGDDNARTHRQIYAANRLLQKKIALPKVLELTQAAVRGVDLSLEVAAPSASVLAEELYDSRRAAMARGQLVIVPDLPRQTLSNILRGRIEEIAGWTLYQQEKPQEAGVRLKRAVGILPEKSAWWRSSMWRMGAAFEAGGRTNEALEAYIKSYASGEPDAAKRAVIESLYQKINGTTEGLEEKIGAKPKPAVSFLIKKAEPTPATATTAAAPIINETAPDRTPQTTAAADETSVQVSQIPAGRVSETAAAQVRISPAVSPEKIELTPAPRVVVTSALPQTESGPPISEIKSEPKVPAETVPAAGEPAPKIAEKPAPQPETKSSPDAAAQPSPESSPSPVVETTPEPSTTPTPDTRQQPVPPAPAPLPEETKPVPTPEAQTTPNAETTLPAETPTAKTSPTPEEEISPALVAISLPPDPSKETVSETSPETAAAPLKTKSNRSPIASPKTKSKLAPDAKIEKTIVAVTDPIAEMEAERKRNEAKRPQQQPAGANKTLFDPIVISVPKTETQPQPKPATDEPTPDETADASKPAETKTGAKVVITDEMSPPVAAVVPASKEEPEISTERAASGEKSSGDDAILLGEQRSRVIVTDALAAKEIVACSLVVSPVAVSLLSNGGMLGLTVGVSGEKAADSDVSKISAVSSSPEDISVTFEPEIGLQSRRAFFVLKSISRKTGIFTVTFDSSCGKKEIQVKVR